MKRTWSRAVPIVPRSDPALEVQLADRGLAVCEGGPVHQTPLHELPSLIRADQLTRSLEHAFTVTPTESAAACAMAMRQFQFDTAPVLNAGLPVGVFHAADAPSAVGNTAVSAIMRPLSARLVVSSQTTLSTLMRRLQLEPFVFVVDDSGTYGFATAADLGTVPVRTHFYLQLANLECALGDYLRSRYPCQLDALALLSEERRRAQKRVADDLRSKDKFVDELSCISLDDLVSIAGGDGEYREATRRAGVGWRRATHGLGDFRNDIMHPTRTLADATDTRPAKLVEWETRLEALIVAASSLAPAEQQ